jgi:hypothetical protein
MSNPVLNPTTEILIESGILVEGDSGTGESREVRLLADVYVQAERVEDGSWMYEIDGELFRCAGGLATDLGLIPPTADGWRHEETEPMERSVEQHMIRATRLMWDDHHKLPAGSNSIIESNIRRLMERFDLSLDDWYSLSKRARKGLTS